MEDPAFEQLIARLEQMAQERPQAYTRAVIGVALLGFLVLGVAVGFALLMVGLIVGFVALVIVTGGKALIFLAKLGKLLILLAIPAWFMVKSTFTMLFSRFPPPQGRTLKPNEAPALFARLEEIRQRMRGPRVHEVLLTDEINAAIVQHPRLGLFGWEKNFLILGLPLLQTLSEEETLAVVAHEYGHLSGHHGRLSGFIYRFRLAWGRLQQLSEQWNDWGSRLIARLFRWYAPYFNAYTFVLARQNEYIADRSAAEIAGAHNAANALMRVNIATMFENEEFWPSIQRRVGQEPEPLGSRSAYWSHSIRAILDEPMRARFLEAANQRKTDYLDTHPALNDRLAALGISADAEAAHQLAPPAASAAVAWFGAHLEEICAEFDQRWRADVDQRWRERHGYLQEQQQRLTELLAQVHPAPDAQWEIIQLLDELNAGEDLMPRIEALLAAVPQHVSAQFRRGALLLVRDDEAGVADLEAAMQQDAEATLAGCEAAWRFYRDRDEQKAEHYAERWRTRSEYEDRVRAELQTLPSDAQLAAPEVDEDILQKIRAILHEHGQNISQAYLLRRTLKSDNQLHDYVLAFETKRLTFGDKSQTVIDLLVKQDFPMQLFIVYLGSDNYKGFRKIIKKLRIAPLKF